MNNRLSPFYKNIALWLLITLVMIFLFNYFNKVDQGKSRTTINYSRFLDLVNGGKVARVTLQGEEITGEQTDGKAFKSYSPADPDLIKLLNDKKVEITAKPKDDSPWYTTLLVSWLHAGAGGHLDFLYAPDAGRRRQGHVLDRKSVV